MAGTSGGFGLTSSVQHGGKGGCRGPGQTPCAPSSLRPWPRCVVVVCLLLQHVSLSRAQRCLRHPCIARPGKGYLLFMEITDLIATVPSNSGSKIKSPSSLPPPPFIGLSATRPETGHPHLCAHSTAYLSLHPIIICVHSFGVIVRDPHQHIGCPACHTHSVLETPHGLSFFCTSSRFPSLSFSGLSSFPASKCWSGLGINPTRVSKVSGFKTSFRPNRIPAWCTYNTHVCTQTQPKRSSTKQFLRSILL